MKTNQEKLNGDGLLIDNEDKDSESDTSTLS